MLAQWQQAHPEAIVQVLVDPELEPFGCVIESEQGRIELGLQRRLEAIKAELSALP
jgi:flagellar biosynthesis/type III secretory pathway protein FliH